MAQDPQQKTFISYSRVNKEFALKLAKELKAEDFTVWLDQLDIPLGARWDVELEKALEECEIFMIIMTPASIGSENVRDEIGYAIDNGKRLLPVMLEKCTIPLRLRRFQYVDFTTKSFDEGVDAAKELLRDLIAHTTTPRATPSEDTHGQIPQTEDARSIQEEAASAEMRAATLSVAPLQKKLASKRMIYGVAGVFVLAILGIGFSAFLKDGVRAPASTETAAAVPSTIDVGSGKIVFNSVRDGNLDIYVMNADGSEQTRLTYDKGVDKYPVWSPDGKHIAFASDRDGNFDIYVMNANGSEQTPLTNDKEYDEGPAWSPDGKYIVFTSRRDGDLEIYIMNADGTEQTQLTTNAAPDLTPAWSPDSKHIAFASDRDGQREMYVMDANGSAQTRLTQDGVGYSFPAWSPDGKKIAFTCVRDGNFNICVMNADGSEQTGLTSNAATNSDPVWSPDGKHIAFTSTRHGDPEIYVMNADGSAQTRLTSNDGMNFDPDWLP